MLKHPLLLPYTLQGGLLSSLHHQRRFRRGATCEHMQGACTDNVDKSRQYGVRVYIGGALGGTGAYVRYGFTDQRRERCWDAGAGKGVDRGV